MILVFGENGRFSVPTSKCPLSVMRAVPVCNSTSWSDFSESKTNFPPSMIRESSIGVCVSNKRVCPFGTMTISPCCGGLPPQVWLELHKSTYEKVWFEIANPLPGTHTFTRDEIDRPLFVVMQIIVSSELEAILHELFAMETETFPVKFFPVISNGVSPAVPPCVALMEVTKAVRERL